MRVPEPLGIERIHRPGNTSKNRQRDKKGNDRLHGYSSICLATPLLPVIVKEVIARLPERDVFRPARGSRRDSARLLLFPRHRFARVNHTRTTARAFPPERVHSGE